LNSKREREKEGVYDGWLKRVFMLPQKRPPSEGYHTLINHQRYNENAVILFNKSGFYVYQSH
jgi:hypothetical protein